ncbi:MAG: septal ring lytic transglycosylase RlpA family protein [Sideroxydans sp.]|nr:septal ring lytic transglycosylase RlpA family protein [Sideroxydans sp.]
MSKRIIWMMGSVVLLSACTSAPQKVVTRSGEAAPIVDLRAGGNVTSAKQPAVGGGYLAGDGPSADTPANLDAIPDAVPKAEPLHRYANRPYSALGKNYTPLQVAGEYKERGVASWYGKKFHGQKTSIGEVYDMFAMTAAHPTLPIPSYARITNPANGKSVVVRVNDRGPFLHSRIMDLSYVAAYKLGYINQGSAEVEVESIAVDANAIAPVTVAAVEPSPVVQVVTPPISAAVVTAPAVAGKIFLQLGAFKSQEGAESFLAKMSDVTSESGKQLSLHQKAGLTRVHLGPYVSAVEARSAAVKLQTALGFKPFVSTR